MVFFVVKTSHWLFFDIFSMALCIPLTSYDFLTTSSSCEVSPIINSTGFCDEFLIDFHTIRVISFERFCTFLKIRHDFPTFTTHFRRFVSDLKFLSGSLKRRIFCFSWLTLYLGLRAKLRTVIPGRRINGLFWHAPNTFFGLQSTRKTTQVTYILLLSGN